MLLNICIYVIFLSRPLIACLKGFPCPYRHSTHQPLPAPFNSTDRSATVFVTFQSVIILSPVHICNQYLLVTSFHFTLCPLTLVCVTVTLKLIYWLLPIRGVWHILGICCENFTNNDNTNRHDTFYKIYHGQSKWIGMAWNHHIFLSDLPSEVVLAWFMGKVLFHGSGNRAYGTCATDFRKKRLIEFA